MTEEQLNKAADSHAFLIFDPRNREYSVKSFKDGARWLMSLPLADRLSESEKERIKAFYNGDTFGELDFIEITSTRKILKNIFGKNLFTPTEQ